MRMTLRTFAAAFSTLLISGCSPSGSDATTPSTDVTGDTAPAAMVDPGEICVTPTLNQDLVRALCKPGQKVAFLPQRWGNEQLPLIFAAFNCDLDATVVVTNGGVVCRYLPQPKSETAEQETDAAGKQPNGDESLGNEGDEQG